MSVSRPAISPPDAEAGPVSVHYPIFLDLADRPCLVVGGGPDRRGQGARAARRRRAGDRGEPHAHAGAGRPRGRGASRASGPRPYAPGDLAGAALAFAASGDRAVSAAMLAEGRARGVWVNSADDAEHCDFFLPAVLAPGGARRWRSRRGGASPALTRAVRDELERYFPAGASAGLVEVVAAVRRDLRERGAPVTRRGAGASALADELARLSAGAGRATGREAPGAPARAAARSAGERGMPRSRVRIWSARGRVIPAC